MDKNFNGYNPNDYSDDHISHRRRTGSGSSSPRRTPSSSGSVHRGTSQSQAAAPSARNTSARRPNASENISKKMKKRNKKQKRQKAFKSFLTGLLVFSIVGVIIGTGVFVGMYAAVMTEIQDMNIDSLVKNHSSYAYYTDKSGNTQELEVLSTTDNSIWADSNEIGENVKQATVAIEDQRFYKHNGIDIKRTFGATFKYALSKIGIGDASYGGSTITQQVIKNITQEKQKSPTRKIKEILRAIALEKQCSKDEILTLYLNIVYFANQCTGIESASELYYGKPATDLSIAEAAAIVGITQTPAKFDPYAHPENTLDKRNVVLKKMYELGMISKDEYKTASASELGVIPKKDKVVNNLHSYFVDQVLLDVIDDLVAKMGYSKEFAEQQVFNGGLQIYTTIDVDIQNTMEKIYNNTSNFPNHGIQSAMVVMDPKNGEVKGIVGGIGQKTARGWNRATQSKRQPGSSIKPVSVYAPAIDNEAITAATVVKDEKITIGSDNWEPKNSYSGFKGDMLISEAVGRSANIPAVKVLQTLGLTKSYNFMEKKLKFSSLVESDKNYSSLALGGLTKGVSVEEMAAAYSVFANGGNYIKPHTYSKVLDSNGDVILENQSSGSRVISEESAYIMTDLLSYPVKASYGTARSSDLGSMPTYGKTGTTSDNYDKWFVGYTPYYVGAVWYGYETNKTISASGNPAISVWKKVMSEIHSNLSSKDFSVPNNVKEVSICTKTGKLPSSSCKSIKAYFKDGTAPTKKCTSHRGSSKGSSSSDDEDDDNSESDSTLKPKKSSEPTHSPTKHPSTEPTKPTVTRAPHTQQPEHEQETKPESKPEAAATETPSKSE